ncbi:MAG: transcriptional repressor [Candidatus Cloacimonetes bacterium]|nr:transcriptional repressor [Candidatus Cloacimonadota bacterium]
MRKIEIMFENYLIKKDLKFTKPRKIILESVLKNKGHFNVDSLYDKIRQKHKNVSRATIYRTMPLLIEAGLVKQALRCQAKDHYENIFGQPSHLHFICTKCGKIIEVRSEEIENILNEIAFTEEFSIKEYNMGAKGLCKKCKGSK